MDQLIRLKEKYKFRILVDESNSLGVLGETGRGITEHFKVPVSSLPLLPVGNCSHVCFSWGTYGIEGRNDKTATLSAHCSSVTCYRTSTNNCEVRQRPAFISCFAFNALSTTIQETDPIPKWGH